MTVDQGQWTEAQLTHAYRQESLQLLRSVAESSRGTRNSTTALLWIVVVLVFLQLMGVLIAVM